MKKFLSTFLIALLVSFASYSQTPTDTIVPKQDSVKPVPVERKLPRITKIKDTTKVKDTTRSLVQIDTSGKRPSAVADTSYGWIKEIDYNLAQHPYFNFAGKAAPQPEVRRIPPDKDLFFYVLLGLFFYFALIKTVFNKYVNNLLAIFLRITLKQQQLREQLLQSPLPSLFLNILFILTGGIYISLLLDFYHQSVTNNFWLQVAYCSGLLITIYTGKLIIMKIVGWIFNIRRATDTYVFIVFLVNKMLGIFLLPFLALIIFEPPQAQQVFVTLSLMVMVMLVLYRFFFSFRPLQNEIRWSLFQFFIYLCAFELAPLFLIYKVLIVIVEKSH